MIRAAHDGGGQGAPTSAFQTGRQAQDFAFTKGFSGDHIHQLGMSLGLGADLIHYERIKYALHRQGLGVFE